MIFGEEIQVSYTERVLLSYRERARKAAKAAAPPKPAAQIIFALALLLVIFLSSTFFALIWPGLVVLR